MKRQYKFYILFLLCLIILPSTVSAHQITFGKQTQSNNKTTIPVIIKADGDITEGSTFSLRCDTNTTNTSCEMNFGGDGIGKEGAVIKPISSGAERQIGTITVTNDTYSASMGTLTLSGNAAGSAVSAKYDFSTGAKEALKATATYTSVKPSQGKMYPEFNKEVFEYTIYDLKDTINSITLNLTCDKCTSKESKYDDNLKFDGDRKTQLKISGLKSGNNNVEVKTLSEDGTSSKLYTFTIIRGETEYDSAKLTTLSVGDYKLSPEFASDTTEYTLSVPYTVKDLTTLIQTTLKDTNAEVEITGADSLKEGTNEVVIKITSVNKDNTMEYKITVTRLSSDDIILISYKDKKITFKDADDKKQTLDEEEFKEKYPTVWEDIQAKKYKFDEEGNLITDEDKEDTKKKDNKVIIVVIIIVVAIILIGGSGYFLFRKKDPEKEEKKKEEKIKKKAEKKARKDKLKKMEEEYYNEYYGEDDEYEDEDETDEESEESSEEDEEDFEIKEKDKLKKDEAKSLLEDDYIFESSLVEEENNEEDEEEDTRTKRHKDDVVDIDSALEDLMNTKTYDFSDELKDVNKINEDDEEDEY